MTELLSENPAKIFGMYPGKGSLDVGADADIVIFDPQIHRLISPKVLHSIVDWNPFDGTELWGRAEKVLLRGHIIVDDDKLLAEPGSGRFIPRNKGNICKL